MIESNHNSCSLTNLEEIAINIIGAQTIHIVEVRYIIWKARNRQIFCTNHQMQTNQPREIKNKCLTILLLLPLVLVVVLLVLVVLMLLMLLLLRVVLVPAICGVKGLTCCRVAIVTGIKGSRLILCGWETTVSYHQLVIFN